MSNALDNPWTRHGLKGAQDAEWFTSIKQAQVVIKAWLKQYNHIRSHQALNMRPPVPETLSGCGT